MAMTITMATTKLITITTATATNTMTNTTTAMGMVATTTTMTVTITMGTITMNPFHTKTCILCMPSLVCIVSIGCNRCRRYLDTYFRLGEIGIVAVAALLLPPHTFVFVFCCCTSAEIQRI